MNKKTIIIRKEKETEFKEISKLVRESFAKGTTYSDGQLEINLIKEIREKPYYIPDLSFVAELEDAVVGYFMFSKFQIEGKREKEVLLLAPVAVKYQLLGKGIGKTMLKEGLKRAGEAGYKGVIVEGNPKFYHTVGFCSASEFSIYPSDKVELPSPECLMAIELCEDGLKGIQGFVDYDIYTTLS